MNYRKFRRGLFKKFDKAFYRSRGDQFLWLISIVFITTLIFIILGNLTGIKALRIIELIIDPGSFVGSDKNGGCIFIQLITTIAGAVVFTSLLINAFGNWLDRRIECYKKGSVFYDFDNHILILGANSMLLNILKALIKTECNKNRDIVILTIGDAEDIRSMIYSEIMKDKAENIYVTYGSRVRKEILQKLDAHEAKSIYILGEDDEPTHDSTNLRCYEILKNICSHSKNSIECYMILERAATLQHFYYKHDNDSTNELHLTVINSLENISQRVIVSREYNENTMYPALDRNGIGEESDKYVHLIIVGMSQMAYFMSTTAAHVCHFPNFRTKRLRTKITFIQDNISQEMSFFVSRYQNLMNLSFYKYINPKNPHLNKENFPKEEYIDIKSDKKGFLDVEWEFIDSGIESTVVREYIENISKDNSNEYITFAFCDTKPEVNIAAAQNLPFSIYLKDIPIFVYQPGGGDVIYSANKTSIYKNLYPFGIKTDCYDKQYQNRMIFARRIKYLYDLEKDGLPFTKMPTDKELLKTWYNDGNPYVFQQSNLYSANSIPFKLRSLGKTNKYKLTEHEIEIISVTEHNRWNIERLLLGFRAYTLAERIRIKDIINGPNKQEKEDIKNIINKNKKESFIHKDIAPYDELTEETKKYDKSIVQNIIEVIQKDVR